MSTSPKPSSPTAPTFTGSIDSKINGTTNGAPKPPTAAPKEEKKLSGKELKAKNAAEKAARRAQKIVPGPSAPVLDAAPKAQRKDSKPVQGKPAAGGPSGAPQNQAGVMNRQRRPSVNALEKPAPKPKAVTKQQVPLFGHLAQQRRHGIGGVSKDVHPAVLSLGLQISRYEVCGSTARVLAMLLSFKAVVQAYHTPANQALNRHFTPQVLSPQIEYLKSCRPLSVSMGNAIRYLKE